MAYTQEEIYEELGEPDDLGSNIALFEVLRELRDVEDEEYSLEGFDDKDGELYFFVDS